jgi:hypothetical protein
MLEMNKKHEKFVFLIEFSLLIFLNSKKILNRKKTNIF